MVLAALAAAFLLLRARRVGGRSPRRAVRPAPDQPAHPEEDPASDAGILARELELLRLATDAHEAALWTRDTGGEQVSLVAWSGFPGRQATDASVVLEGHPFRWILDERVHVRLERGRRTLPTAWAEEMLLVPVDAPDGLLALAYPGGIPPGAEASALLAGAQLGSLLSLLRAKEQGARREAHVGALYRAVELLPHQLDRDRFAEALADVVREGVGAAGVAVIAWSADTGTGEILRLTGDDPHGVAEGNRLEEGDSRATLAAKHAVALPYPDLRRERDRIPLVARGESWRLAPRSALVVPLSAEGQVLGVVVAWHGEAEHFGEPERSFLDHLSALAPFPLRSAQRYEALDRTANQDPLTGLHNRRAFDARFAAAAAHFSRYHRPFS
ncbi:MAG: GAF domain-containing protein, partial [Gemmatimonadota bacterium]|nr:GAF domain-containing protein [Gemmatimonadota bacterium]